MPAVIASVVPNVYWMIAVWVAGGGVALIGALCFAELTTSYPDRGGDYGYLKRAYSRHIGFAFSWTAFWVIRPTSIALMAIIFGEFAIAVFPETLSVLWFSIAAIVGLSLTNLLGVRCGKSAQNVLTVAKVVGILIVVLAAFAFWPDSTSAKAGDGASGVANVEVANVEVANVEVANVEVAKTLDQVEPAEQEETEESAWEWFWLSMVYVMFTFGGWNDIAFVATETREPKKNLFRALVIGTGVVLLVYLLFNFALMYGLGFDRLKELGGNWENATSVLVEQNMGELGGWLVSILVCVSCLGAINAMIFTSPRIYWATASDYPGLAWMTGADAGRGWGRSMLLQALVTIIYVATFGGDKHGVENLTNANAPFFWFFLALTVASLMISRVRFPGKFDGYRVPLYPVLPIVFIGACLFMVYRSWSWMMQQELAIPAMAIGGWVVVGVVLSFVLRTNDQSTR
ncbi:MAG: APA family basic amino acid/polyamine antiporter [Mariniblastus sp.]|jgi:APA family basic amino acid/polyamine antiporter